MVFYSKFAPWYDLIFPFKPTVYDFLSRVITENTRDVLDVGCGTGHYTARFTQQGFKALGIDLDAAMINYARIKYPQTEFIIMNMLDLDSIERSFDYMYCIGNTVAHLTKNELAYTLKSVYEHLRSGGIWCFQVLNWDYVTQQQEYRFPVLTAEGDLQFIRTYTDISRESVTFNTQLFKQGRTIFDESVILYPILFEDYNKIHTEYGFKLLGIYSDFQRSEFDPARDSAEICVFQKL